MVKPRDGQSVAIVSFSPTGTTEQITEAIAAGLGATTPIRWRITLPHVRDELAQAMAGGPPVFDWWVVGAPVYAGKLPPVAVEALSGLRLDGQRAVGCVTYGNAEYGTAPRELTRLLEGAGATVVATGAFVGEHSFSAAYPIAIGRPDEGDLRVAQELGRSVAAGEVGGRGVSWKEIGGSIRLSTRLMPAKGPQPVVEVMSYRVV